ncbi:MAG: UDP-3-O-(3-hydroxymyristoyl)glucosamine N-acyltransferase [Geminicoccaceae bacterium]
MADPRFHPLPEPRRLGDIAEFVACDLQGGDPQSLIIGIAALDKAGPQELSFLDNKKYLDAARQTRAAAVFIKPELADALPEGCARLLTDDPYRTYAIAALAAYGVRDPRDEAGIHPGAHVDPEASLGEGCSIDAGAVIRPGAMLGARCRIEPNAVIGRNVSLGDDTIIGPGASLSHCMVGSRVIIHAGVRIGQDGFGFAMGPKGHVKVPQLGRVIIEDDVEIGANSTIDRGSGQDTVIGRGCKVDNLVMIAHNVRLGPGCVIVAQSGISGSAQLGTGVVLAAQSGVTGHLEIGDGAVFAARSAIIRDMPGGETYGGAPAVPVRQWRRQMAAWHRLTREKGHKG